MKSADVTGAFVSFTNASADVTDAFVSFTNATFLIYSDPYKTYHLSYF
jgi:hypothetical protein